MSRVTERDGYFIQFQLPVCLKLWILHTSYPRPHPLRSFLSFVQLNFSGRTQITTLISHTNNVEALVTRDSSVRLPTNYKLRTKVSIRESRRTTCPTIFNISLQNSVPAEKTIEPGYIAGIEL